MAGYATGGGAGGYNPDGSYTGGGMSGDPSRPAGAQYGDLAKKMYNPDGSLTGYNGLDPANNTGGGARLANQQGPQNAGASFGQTAPSGVTPWSNGNTQSPGMAQQQAPGFAQQSPGMAGGNSMQGMSPMQSTPSGGAMQGMSPMGGNPYSQPQAAMPSQNLGMGAPPMQAASAPVPSASGQGDFGKNPWLQQQGQAMQAQSNQNLKQNVLPGIGQGAQAQGMYGSSRQGTAEGIAMGNAQTGVNSALANMYGQSYGQDQQYSLGQQNIASQAGIANAQMANQFALGQMNNNTAMRGQDQSYNLGQGNLALGNKQADNSYNLGLGNQNLNYSQLDSQNAQFGANYGLQAQNYQNQWANNNVNAANQMAQTPWNQFNNSAGMANQIAGQGGSTSQTNQGNPWLGAIGGAQIGNKLFGG